MADDSRPQLYLLTPPVIAPDSFPQILARVLDGAEIACLRLTLATRDAGQIARAADACREVAHARDVAIVIDSHLKLVEPHGLDGVHLDGARGVRAARKELGADAIVGAFCHASRHDGMIAAEAGADYVSFGPVGGAGLGDGTLADRELFAWWSEMIEVPVVAEGGLTADLAARFAPISDFIALGEEIWRAEDPLAELTAFLLRF